MGNCLKRSSQDDISLLRGGNEPGRESTEQLGPSPLYSVSNYRIFVCPILFHPIAKCFVHFSLFAGSIATGILSIAIGESSTDSSN